MRRLRVLHVLVQPVLVWDDGDTLTPGPSLQPQAVAVADLANLAPSIDTQLIALQDQLDAETSA